MTQGRLLAGRYELGELIGRGGMAEVHLGHDTRLGRPVAIKILRSDHARDASFLARFRREAQSVASLDHPNIVKVYDSGDEEFTEAGGGTIPVPYIVMEYVDGVTLRDVLNEHGTVEPFEAARIVAMVLDALEYSHSRGIVHRDIKPGNVMITPEGAVKVMDFGIARAVADTQATMTQTSAVVGTAQYISPEQAQGHVVDHRSDVYSTGCLLFELLTGRTPFTGDPISLTYQHVSKTPPMASTFNPQVPEKLDAVIAHALTKDREIRYPSADQMRLDLLAFLNGRPISDEATAKLTAVVAPTELTPAYAAPRTEAPTGTTPVAGMPPARRGPGRAIWAAVMGALVIALGLATFAWYQSANPDTFSVPQVVGMSKQTATTTLKSAGFAVDERPVTSDKPVDEVVAQDPADGAKVTKGTRVRIDISSGPGSTAVPSLEGLTVSEASKKLEDVGLKLGETSTKNDNTLARGKIISSDPDAGAGVPRGSKVNVVLSSGKITLPDLVGKNLNEVRTILFDLGVSPERLKVTEVESDKPAGTVLDQSPGAGEISNTATITLKVAKARAATPSSSTPSDPGSTAPSPSTEPTPGQTP